MPTLFKIQGFRFFFFSREHLPLHIHVSKASGAAKFILVPEVSLIENKGMSQKDIKKAKRMVCENRTKIIEEWYTFHGKK